MGAHVMKFPKMHRHCGRWFRTRAAYERHLKLVGETESTSYLTGRHRPGKMTFEQRKRRSVEAYAALG